MLNEAKVKQTYQTYLQFEKAISKISYNGLLDLLDNKELGEMCCELSDILAAVRTIKKERNKHNKLEAV
jgi:hypothetical protein